MNDAAKVFSRPIWPALPAAGRPAEPLEHLRQAVDAAWQPLGQAWNPHGLEAGFRPGWARITWEPGGLWFDAVLASRHPRNRARRLNENTWELGDVCEVFLEVPGAARYVELHVTPENQRLQLTWPPDGLQLFRAGRAPLETFLDHRADWVRSATFIGADHWAARVFIPADRFGARPLAAGQTFHAAVCRYDVGDNPGFVLSSTAPLRGPSYHRREEWHQVRLAPAPA